MYIDRRNETRLEPPCLDAKVVIGTNIVPARVLDISPHGMAVMLPETANLPATGIDVDVTIIGEDLPPTDTALGNAAIKRGWSQPRGLNKGKGISFQFVNDITPVNLATSFFRGINQRTRLATQKKLSVLDITYLGAYRRSLTTCQINLFMLTLTVGVALASAYFGLTYYGIAQGKAYNQYLEFWRTMIAAMPGVLAIFCALMVAQKNISIQKIDAYLAVLKECTVRNQFPREYRGWETDNKRFREILGKGNCNTCKNSDSCLPRSDSEQAGNTRGLFKNPRVDFYHVLVNMVFLSAVCLSLAATVIAIPGYIKMGAVGYIVTGVLIAVLLTGISIYLFKIFFRLRKGRYSVHYFKECWLHVLRDCRKRD